MMAMKSSLDKLSSGDSEDMSTTYFLYRQGTRRTKGGREVDIPSVMQWAVPKLCPEIVHDAKFR